ncbi:hypothetical protein AT239_05285 [Bartonella henselae]|nr:hypothetical protein AT239_05285 [Bartonella henselae]OLL56687.1 hypothetical protein AT240_04730 [Bartonella henselae]
MGPLPAKKPLRPEKDPMTGARVYALKSPVASFFLPFDSWRKQTRLSPTTMPLLHDGVRDLVNVFHLLWSIFVIRQVPLHNRLG